MRKVRDLLGYSITVLIPATAWFWFTFKNNSSLIMQRPPITPDPFRYIHMTRFFKDDPLASFDSLNLPKLLLSSNLRAHPDILPSDEIEGAMRALISGKPALLDTTLAYRSSPRRMVIVDRKGRTEGRKKSP